MLARSLSGIYLWLAMSLGGVSAFEIDVATTPRPDFVTPSTPFDPALDDRAPLSDGIRMRLQERDVQLAHDGSRIDWHAVEYVLVNRTGLEQHGRYSIAFAPADERLSLHGIQIRRDGRVTERLSGTRIDVLRREPDAALVQNGLHDVGLLIPDLVVGDIVRVHWSIERAAGPVNDETGHAMGHEITVPLDGAWPVARRLVRIRTPVDRPLTMRDGRVDGTRDVPAISTRTEDGVTVYRVDQHDSPVAVADDALLPPVDRSYARLVFSDAAGWRGVAEAHARLYVLPATVTPELAREARRIRAAHVDEASRAAAALHWAQTRVRYYALQMGEGAFTPASAADTLRLGYGDCKGKTLLLLGLLDELGIAASAALTSLDGRASAPRQPWRWQAFDHVLVHASIDGRGLWLDPSDSHQRGSLGQRRAPDHGHALRLDTGQLVPMRVPGNEVPMIDVTRRVGRLGDAHVFEVVTRRARDAAEALRRDRERIDDAALAASRHDYYRLRRALPVSTLGSARIQDSVDGVSTRERYSIDESAALASFATADEIRDRLLRWRDHAIGRTAPLALASTLSLRERVIIDGLRPGVGAAGQRRIDSPWFGLERILRHDDASGALVIDYRLTALASRVDAAQMPAFRTALGQALALVEQVPLAEPRPAATVAQAVGASSLLAFGWLCAARRRRHLSVDSSPSEPDLTGCSMVPSPPKSDV